MLDSNSLQQLSQLKSVIRSDKNLAQGIVRGSQGRFGFVTLDDGREAFLAPDEMAKVIPGDRVEVSIKSNDDPNSTKLDATLDKLIKASRPNLIGRYIVRGKGHFLAVDMPQFSRWFFIPPKSRGKAKEGDYLMGKLQKHPFEDGKGMARIETIIGSDESANIEHKLTCLKHGLPTQWTESQLSEAKSIAQSPPLENRTDLTKLGFVTIDSESTKDMDDALFIEQHANGWTLHIAIADPSSAIEPGSELDLAALERANTAYLPGEAITMLPGELSHSTFSLMAEQVRPALVCRLSVDTNGVVTHSEFEQAIIQSQQKLSYEQVAKFLEEDDKTAIHEDFHSMCQELLLCTQALRKEREKQQLLMEPQDDYELILDNQGHIESIVQQPNNLAKQVVEESMLATNNAAGRLLAQHPNFGIFSAHLGFRPERLASIQQVIQEDLPALGTLNLAEAEGYKELIQTLQKDEPNKSLLAAFKMMLQAGLLSREAQPHFGLGMDYYATITSPIRRYNDLHNHRAIKAILLGQTCQAPSEEELSQLQQRVGRTRQASRDLTQWLQCLFMQAQTATAFEAKVTRVTSQGVTAEITQWGISGFVKVNPKAFQFDPERMRLAGETESFAIGDDIRVAVDKIDLEKKRMNFSKVTAND